ncbi:NAD(P)/FAD-dependent oxidoreductase [Flavitalea sp.]|nr:NAD(P)/FAD-dependent oxidoreductase [Flavitalea sp.]
MKKALIIGAGPAGLTAAYELLTRTDIIPVIIEADKQVGGISKTIDYKGNKIDIGGHRFFSKSPKVIDWWLGFLPLDPRHKGETLNLRYQNNEHTQKLKQQQEPDAAVAKLEQVTNQDKVMLVRKRKSRIFYNRKFFNYPLKLNAGTLSQLGLIKTCKTAFSYLYSKVLPQKPELTLEQFFINRFGKELYNTFFKDYTEKVWGVPCNSIPASWGQQRIKNLNIGKMVAQAIKSVFISNNSIDQKGTSTSLIEQFLYPKYGPGQMWETVADAIIRLGGEIYLNSNVTGITGDKAETIISAEITDLHTGEKTIHKADYFFSTMPIKELFEITNDLPVPAQVKNTALSLEYRDFLIVGVLSGKLRVKEKSGSDITDNWIYIQDKNVKAGRLQFFHNWSPFMISNPGDMWIGVEYFCNETDEFWNLPDHELSKFAIKEIESIGILAASDVSDTTVIRVKKAYPSYYGSYSNFNIIRDYLNKLENFFPIGRNGMHRYNNSDHSMLTAIAAVDNIVSGEKDKSNIWEINTGDEYHEESGK